MKKKIILLASFAIIAGSSVLFALNNRNTNSGCTGSCCSQKSCCTTQSCENACTCGDECTGEGCECGCSCCN